MKDTSKIKVHKHQLGILKKLVISPELRFNQLLIEEIESEHMNYHLKRLIEHGLIIKNGHLYTLTDLGKDYTNLLDDDVKKVEKQPKTGVIIRAPRINTETGEIEDLFTKRLRQPYYGKVGRIGGKVQFGETLEEAARRELHEESGLIAEKMTLEQIYHKIRHREDGTCVQDVIFYIFLAENVSGDLIDTTEFQENFWGLRSEVEGHMDPYDDLEYSTTLKPRPLEFVEHVDIADGF